MRARQRQATEQSDVETSNPGVVLRTRFDRTATFSDREVVALPDYGALVDELNQIVEHHVMAAQSHDYRI